MQKFGLQRTSSSHNSAIELEIVREQASALGRAGRKLRISLEAYESMCSKKQGIPDDKRLIQEHDFILEISNNVWELMLQREFLGFIENNLRWVKDNYDIPDAALRRLGDC